MSTSDKEVSFLSLDQGTTSTRAILFDADLQPTHSSQEEFAQYFPKSGWVEHEASDLIYTSVNVIKNVLEESGKKPLALGITNQRQTTVVWDCDTGEALGKAIVWQDRRTAEHCETLKNEGFEAEITARTGLLLDPYFSATKLAYILDNNEGAREKAKAGKLKFGTVDSWLIWHLTEGKLHACDATNAACTMLYNIHEGAWDKTICDKFGIPLEMLPEVKDCADDYGICTLFGYDLPIRGVAGDQQAALVGQACFTPGMMKSTYGTGCFALMNTGETPVHSNNRMLTTIGYQLNGKPTYALEGSIFIAGAVVQWLRDGLGIIEKASDTLEMAKAADPNQDLYLVPAFTGLGAPWWDAQARGAIYGLTRNSGPNEFAKAALESVGYQTRDLIEAIKADWPDAEKTTLRVDGGMSASDYTMQFLADILGASVNRPKNVETTALGAAYLAGLAMNALPEPDEFSKNWQSDASYHPDMPEELRARKYDGWADAIKRTLVN